MRLPLLLGACAAAAIVPNAHAREMVSGGKLLLTRGVTQVEGAGGGGLAPWALITGNETDAGVGISVFATTLSLPDYNFRAIGGAVGFFDRLEVSYAHQEFDTGGTGAKLGLGPGFTFDQDVVGAKLRVLGDAVYDQDHWLPQVAIGVQYKHNNQDAVLHAIGARRADGVDAYVTATKIVLSKSLVLNGTVRFTDANQFGILGFGGDREDRHTLQAEASAAYMVTDRLVVGAEYRSRPDNLGFAHERDAVDLFAAYAVNHNLTVTAAYVDLGPVATLEHQHGLYISLQAGF